MAHAFALCLLAAIWFIFRILSRCIIRAVQVVPSANYATVAAAVENAGDGTLIQVKSEALCRSDVQAGMHGMVLS